MSITVDTEKWMSIIYRMTELLAHRMLWLVSLLNHRAIARYFMVVWPKSTYTAHSI